MADIHIIEVVTPADPAVVQDVELVVGPTGPQGPSGTITVGEGLVNTGTPTAAELELDAAFLNSTYPRGQAGRRYKMILGAIRNTGSGFETINDSAHRPSFIDSVSQSATDITINYSSLGGDRVVSLIVAPDEAFAAAGMSAGASVGLTSARIEVWRDRPAVTGSIQWSGSAWTITGGDGITSVGALGTPTAGELQINHDSVAGVDVQLTGRGNSFRPVVSANLGAVAATFTRVSFVDTSGAIVNTPNSNMKMFFRRGGRARQRMNPADLNSTNYPLSNFWIIGVMESAN